MPVGRVNSGRDSEGPDTDIVVVGVGPPCAKAENAPVAPKAAAAMNSRVARISIAIAASPAKYSTLIGPCSTVCIRSHPSGSSPDLARPLNLGAADHFAIVNGKF
jgi:hypothetical protein